jgi:tetratricopeptide (TPR) repeat protein
MRAMADVPSNKLVKRPDDALVKKAVAAHAPPMRLADSLEDAAPRTFVHVDRKGQVRSPARYKALQAASYGAAAAIVGGVTVMYGALLGVPGIGVGAAFAAYFGWHLRRSRLLHKATVLLVHDQLDEAEALLRKVLASWRCPKHVAALAEQNLGAVYNRRGNFEEALAHQRAAMTLYARGNAKSPMRQVVEYAEIITLVNLGRVGEARQRLDQKQGKVPEGDYLRMQHWGAELYVCLAEGEHRLDPEQLHQCAIAALKITGAAALLGLSAWAHWKLGDSDQAWHLLNEAYDRRQGVRLERALPLLWKWMEEHATEAGVDRSIGADEPAAEDDPLGGL